MPASAEPASNAETPTNTPIITKDQKTTRVTRMLGVCLDVQSLNAFEPELVRSSNLTARSIHRTSIAASHAIRRKMINTSTNARIPGNRVAIFVKTRPMDPRNDSSTCCHIIVLLLHGLNRSGHLHRDTRYGLPSS